LGTRGLNFNCFEKASLITRACRKGLQKCIIWATGHDYLHWWKPDDTLYKEIEVPVESVQEYLEQYEHRCVVKESSDPDTVILYVPKYKTKGKYKVSYVHSNTGRDDFDDYEFIDSKAEWTVDEMPKHDWVLVNIDTDSLSFTKKDGSAYTDEEKEMIHEEINKIMYSEWEDDGMFDRVVVCKAKNYVLKTGDKIKFKGSSLIDTKKEPALLEMLNRLINECFIYNTNTPDAIYKEYINEVINIKDISRWASKKSVTKKLYESDRANETKVVDAIKDGDYSIGDKVFLFSAIDGEKPCLVKGVPKILKKTGQVKMVPNHVLKLAEKFDGDYDMKHYLGRVYDTVSILENIVDMSTIPSYTSVVEFNKLQEKLQNE